MKVDLNVKDKSVQTFLEERLLGYKADERNDMRRMEETSPYHLMRNEMFFKKDCGIDVGQIVTIELFDKARMSGVDLKNIYTYKVEEYDDVAVKMVLNDFAVELIKGEIKKSVHL